MSLTVAGAVAIIVAIIVGLLTRFDNIAIIIGVLGVIAIIAGLIMSRSNNGPPRPGI